MKASRAGKAEKEAPSKTRDKVREAERLYRSLFSQSPFGILIIDTDGRFIDFNEAAHRQLGYTREEFAKLSLKDIDPFQSPEEIGASIREVMEKGSASFEVRHRTKEGEIRNVHVITQLLELEGGTVFHTIWRDITERRRAEEAKNALIRELERALAKVKLLSGFIPICASCKKIRDDKGFWNQLEAYIRDHSEAEFSHSICPDCARKFYLELDQENDN